MTVNARAAFLPVTAFRPLGQRAHYRLTARMDVDLLDRHLLLTFAAAITSALRPVPRQEWDLVPTSSLRRAEPASYSRHRRA